MILFFDTETTGLPKNWKAPVTDLDNWPRLVQIAYLVYDNDGNLIHSCNEIIKPNGFTIPVEASNIHGITTEIANQRGSKIADIFEIFLIHLKRAHTIVAHNMAYDEKIVGSELIRLGLDNVLDIKERICTMQSTVDLCKINGPYGYKWPKLQELHYFLFKSNFEGAHDALADIQATAKCFWRLVEDKAIILKNSLNINSSQENIQNSEIYKAIEDEIQFAIKNKKNLKIKYKNYENEITERVISNVEFSENILSQDDLGLFNIDSNSTYITAFCTLRNDQRTFKIDRILEASLIKENHIYKDNSNIKIPIFIPCTKGGISKIINSITHETELLLDERNSGATFFNYFHQNTLELITPRDWELRGFFNKTSPGKLRLIEWFDYIHKLNENYAIVTFNEKKRIINVNERIETNNYLYNEYWYDDIRIKNENSDSNFRINCELNNEKAIMKKNGKWGVINFDNEILLEPKYDSFIILNDQLLLVWKDENIGVFNFGNLNWEINPNIELKVNPTHQFEHISIIQNDYDYYTKFHIIIGNKLVKEMEFTRKDLPTEIEDLIIKPYKNYNDHCIYFVVSKRIPLFIPARTLKQLFNGYNGSHTFLIPIKTFNLTENKDRTGSGVNNSLVNLDKKDWELYRFIVREKVEKNQCNKYFIPLEETNWKIINNSKNSKTIKIYYKEELLFKFQHAQSVKFGPFINGITELEVIYSEDYFKNISSRYFGYVYIQGNYYFDYDINSDDLDDTSNEDDSLNEDDIEMPF